MFLKPHQMYLESQGLYQNVCRLAQVRVQLKALQVEMDALEQTISESMFPASELVDLTFLRSQKDVVSEEELSGMFVVRKEVDGFLTVHPAYVSERFRPEGTLPADPSPTPAQQRELFASEKDDEREVTPSPAPQPLQEKEEEREAAAADSSIDVEGFITFFNRMMPKDGIPHIQCLQGKRLEMLRARCREFGKGAVVQMIQNAARSLFLNGRGKRGWRASIDWLLKPNNFPKVLEGIYYDVQKKGVMSPERREANRAIEQQMHEELWRSIEERERNCVTYEEYLKLKEAGVC